jgi:predicted enzyme related to lactoylglutathione lyase
MKPSQSSIRVEAILIETPDLQALAEFYRVAFDLPAPISEGDDHLGFRLANVYLGFDRIPSVGGYVVRPISIWFRVEDVPAQFERLLAAGARAIIAPSTEASPGEVLATAYDPEGNLIGLIAPVA